MGVNLYKSCDIPLIFFWLECLAKYFGVNRESFSNCVARNGSDVGTDVRVFVHGPCCPCCNISQEMRAYRKAFLCAFFKFSVFVTIPHQFKEFCHSPTCVNFQ